MSTTARARMTRSAVRTVALTIGALATLGLASCSKNTASSTSATTAKATTSTEGGASTTATTAAPTTSSTTAPVGPTVDLTATTFGDIKIGSTEQAVRDALNAMKAGVTDGITPPCFGKADKTISAGSVQFAITGGKLTGFWVDSTFGMGFPTAITVLGGQKFLGTQVGSIKPVGLTTPAEKIESDGTIVRSMTDTQPPLRIVAEPGGMVISGGVAPTACIAIG